MASISEMIVEQTVMSRSALVNLRRFSGGGGGVDVFVVDESPRRDERVVDVSFSLGFGDAATGGGGGDASRSLSTGDDFFDGATEFAVDVLTACGSSFVSSFPPLTSLLFDTMLLLVEESSVSGGCKR